MRAAASSFSPSRVNSLVKLDVRCQIPDARCPMPDARYPIKISDVRQRKSDVGHRASVIGLRFFLAPERRDLEQRLGAVGDAGFSDLDLDDILAAREIEHDLHQHFLENCAEATRAGPPLQRLLRDCGESSLVERDLHFLEPEELRVLLREGVLRLLENPDQRLLVERLERNRNGQTADQLGDQPVAKQVVRLDLREHLCRSRRLILPSGQVVESDLPPAGASLDDLLETVERSAADEQDVLRVELDVLLLRMLASTLRRDRRNCSLDDLEERLLYALTRDVARDAGVLRLPRDLVDLVDVNDPALALGDIEVAGLQEPDENVLHVFADISRFGQRRGVGDREGNVEDPREGPGEKRLAHSRRADQENVRLVELHIIVLERRGVDSLVVIVDRYRQRFLGLLLPDHVLVQNVLDLLRRGDLGYRLRNLSLLVLGQDLIAERNALVADVHRWTGDELPDRVLRFSAKGAAEVLVLRHRPGCEGRKRVLLNN